MSKENATPQSPSAFKHSIAPPTSPRKPFVKKIAAESPALFRGLFKGSANDDADDPSDDRLLAMSGAMAKELSVALKAKASAETRATELAARGEAKDRALRQAQALLREAAANRPSPSSKTTSYTSQFTSFGFEGVAQPGYHSRASSSLHASSCQPHNTREFSASLRRVIVVVWDASSTASFARRAARKAGSAWSSINSSKAASSPLFTVPYFCACARVSCTSPSSFVACSAFSATKLLNSAA